MGEKFLDRWMFNIVNKVSVRGIESINMVEESDRFFFSVTGKDGTHSLIEPDASNFYSDMFGSFEFCSLKGISVSDDRCRFVFNDGECYEYAKKSGKKVLRESNLFFVPEEAAEDMYNGKIFVSEQMSFSNIFDFLADSLCMEKEIDVCEKQIRDHAGLERV